MIIKKITLKNIRSYKFHELEFPKGSTLLSGDIGAGKTSILLAIEFALFGLQPGQRGAFLLRNGETDGGVVMEFEVENQSVVIERTLKKGSKTISQDYCSITIDGQKQEISVIELKNRVLELLNYPKEFAKRQNLLYKFTVYTPQEEMKQIILQDSDTRINTLRHVFGIDKYKKILENTLILATKIREEKRTKEILTMNLENDKQQLISKENDIQNKQENLISIEKELFLKIEERKNIQEEKEEIYKKIEEKNKLQQEIDKTKIMISNKKDSIFNNQKIIDQLKIQIQELNNLNFDESKILELDKQIDFKKQEKEKLNEENMKISSEVTSLKIKNSENENIKNKLIHIEVCPTCLQDVNSTYKQNVTNKLNSNTYSNLERINSLEFQKQKINQDIFNINQEISGFEKQIRDLNIMKIKFQGIEEKQKRLEEIEKSNAFLANDVSMLTKHIENLQSSIFELNRFQNIFEMKTKLLEEAIRNERMAEIKVAELKKEIEVFSYHINELKEKINQTGEIKKQLDYLTELENWLSKKFVNLISFIEKNVMLKLKSEFSNLFSEWFGMLVSDTFNVRLGDDFTPIVEQQDYEIDYAYLSGGERTAIALAYRLSLNQVINSFLSKIKTKDLVILDEPTDGFSEQQLDKMRDVLQQLNVQQLIIVSHEQKIEGFVENVIKIKKEKGTSAESTETALLKIS